MITNFHTEASDNLGCELNLCQCKRPFIFPVLATQISQVATDTTGPIMRRNSARSHPPMRYNVI